MSCVWKDGRYLQQKQLKNVSFGVQVSLGFMEHLNVVWEFEDGEVIQVSPESQSGACLSRCFFQFIIAPY